MKTGGQEFYPVRKLRTILSGLLLVAELLNSAIEDLCDFVQDRRDPRIRVIKDIGSAAVGTSILVWAVVLVIEVVHLLGLIW